MKEMIIREEDVGKPFLEMLEKLLDIRKDKRKIYGDEYLNDSVEFLILTTENKLKRVRQHILNNTLYNDIEKAEDNLLDLAIYSMFLAINIQKTDEK